MKKGISLYLTFAILCVIAVFFCLAGCNETTEPTGNDASTSSVVTENPNNGLITSRYENDDYDRTDVSNTISNYGKDEETSSTTSTGSSSTETTSSEDTGVTSSEDSGATSSETATSSGIKYSSDNDGWTSRWY